MQTACFACSATQVHLTEFEYVTGKGKFIRLTFLTHFNGEKVDVLVVPFTSHFQVAPVCHWVKTYDRFLFIKYNTEKTRVCYPRTLTAQQLQDMEAYLQDRVRKKMLGDVSGDQIGNKDEV